MNEALQSVFNVLERSNNEYMVKDSSDTYINIPTTSNTNETRNSFEGFRYNK